MAKTGSNFSILADVELDLTSIKEQLKKAKITFDIDGKSIKVAGQSLDELAKQVNKASESTGKLNKKSKDAKDGFDDIALSVDMAGRTFGAAKETISAFTEQVFELDSALTEFMI